MLKGYQSQSKVPYLTYNSRPRSPQVGELPLNSYVLKEACVYTTDAALPKTLCRLNYQARYAHPRTLLD